MKLYFFLGLVFWTIGLQAQDTRLTHGPELGLSITGAGTGLRYYENNLDDIADAKVLPAIGYTLYYRLNERTRINGGLAYQQYQRRLVSETVNELNGEIISYKREFLDYGYNSISSRIGIEHLVGNIESSKMSFIIGVEPFYILSAWDQGKRYTVFVDNQVTHHSSWSLNPFTKTHYSKMKRLSNTIYSGLAFSMGKYKISVYYRTGKPLIYSPSRSSRVDGDRYLSNSSLQVRLQYIPK
jgi:hypothetical protein